MATFTAWIHLRDRGLRERQFTHWGGGLIEDLFPDHQRVVAEYHELPPHGDIKVYTGTMSHYMTGADEAGAPNIVSSFVAWDCYKSCDQTQHRFTRHEFAPSDGEPHCICDFAEPQFYDPDAAPLFSYQIFSKETGGINQDDDQVQVSCWQRYFIVQCRECQIRCRLAVDQTWRDASGRKLGDLHVCHGDPINGGVLAAARYRELPQNQVPAGGNQDQEDQAGAGDEVLGEDDHGGNLDQEDQAGAGDKNLSEDDVRGGNQDQDTGDGSSSNSQSTAGGNQDQEDQASAGDEDLGEDDRDGNQEQGGNQDQDKGDCSRSGSQSTAGGNQDQEDQASAVDEDLGEDDRDRNQEQEDQDKGDGSSSDSRSNASVWSYF